MCVAVSGVFHHRVRPPAFAVPHRAYERVVVVDVDDEEVTYHVWVRFDVALVGS